MQLSKSSLSVEFPFSSTACTCRKIGNFHSASSLFIHSRKFHMFLMILLKMILFVYFLLKNLKMTQPLRLILWHASRFSGEISTSVRNKALHIVFSGCVSWIFSVIGFISIISLGRFLRRVQRVSLQCFNLLSQRFATLFSNFDFRLHESTFLKKFVKSWT